MVTAFAAGMAEAGAQYRSVFGPRRSGVGIEVYYSDLAGLLLSGRGNAWYVDALGEHRLIP